MTEGRLDPLLIEQRLAQIRGVISALVVTLDNGDIGEIHVMATTQRTAKQLVRDIESLVILLFGTKLDYRKISIVQLEARHVALVSRVRLKAIGSERQGDTLIWSVSLVYDRVDLTGRWEGTYEVTEAEGAALATLDALTVLVGPACALSLIEAKVAVIDQGNVVIASVKTGEPPKQETLLGGSFVKTTVAEAAARAVLSALNRRLPFTVE